MLRPLLGSVLLVATLVTGILAGSTGETTGRSIVRVRTEEYAPAEERVTTPDRVVAPAAGEEVRARNTASATTRKEDSPEASDLVTRMRRYLSDLGEDEAAKIRDYHKDYKKRLNERSLAVTAMLLADAASQRRAVEKMRELRRERREFMRDLLGAKRWDSWKQVELNGGRNVNELLRVLQERNKENEK